MKAHYDEKHLLHSIFGTALYSQIVNDKQVVLIKAGDKVGPVLREHPGQAVQNGGDRKSTRLNSSHAR